MPVDLNKYVAVVRELSPEVEAAFADVQIVALDVEGVDLSRAGNKIIVFDERY